MATVRKIVFRNNELYHIFNRGIERRPTFNDQKEFERMLSLIKFYRHAEIPIRYSQLINQPLETRTKIFEEVYRSECIVDILCYCLMPNHFHLLIKQIEDNGITKFMSNITNAYTKYFNTKNDRAGPLFEGAFKAVHVETDEQLIHLSRYIHLNPVVSSLIEEDELERFQWSSYREYMSLNSLDISQKDFILQMFKSTQDYKQFVMNQIEYGKQLEVIKHLTFD